MTKKILLAEITGAHGIKGLVKVKSYAQDSDILQSHPLLTDAGKIKLKLDSATNTHLIAEVEGVLDRTQAEKLRGTKLYIDRDSLPEPEVGQYYFVDLIGLRALDENGTEIGTVTGHANYGAGDMLDIKPETGENFYVLLHQNILEVSEGYIKLVVPEESSE